MKRVIRRFPKKRFVQVGDLSSDRFGLSRRRGQELALLHAWARAAGPVLAPKARPLGVRRGVLEVQLSEEDESWRRTLLDVLPRLGAVIAAARSEQRIEQVQLFSPEGEAIGPVLPVDNRSIVRAARVKTRIDRVLDAGNRAKPLDDARMEALMQAYLERCSETDGSSGP